MNIHGRRRDTRGGVGFTKTPAGRFYHDYYGENLFRSDMGIERTTLGSLLDHTGAFGESEKTPPAYSVLTALVRGCRDLRF